MTGIMSTGIPGDDWKALREHVNDLALALIAPLRAYDYRSPASAQSQLHGSICGTQAAVRVAHTSCPQYLQRKREFI
jgi:hypothetical protein